MKLPNTRFLFQTRQVSHETYVCVHVCVCVRVLAVSSLFRGKLTVFTVLCEQYQPSLKRDPMYNEYLDRIGQLFFGVPPKQTSSYGGLLGNLLNSLMVAGEEEETEEEQQENSSPIELD
uniref:Uncharacterized protein n=1 Tax=Micrurus corallinus TaxID=54390 RepID=A0A2D4FVU0_MICCO